MLALLLILSPALWGLHCGSGKRTGELCTSSTDCPGGSCENGQCIQLTSSDGTNTSSDSDSTVGAEVVANDGALGNEEADVGSDTGSGDLQICQPNVSTCDSGVQTTCNSAGTGYQTQPCVFGCDGPKGVCVQKLVANAGSASLITCDGATVLNGSALGGDGQYTVKWSPETGLSDPTSFTPTATAKRTRKYLLTVTDGKGQVATDSVTLTVAPTGPEDLRTWTKIAIAAGGSESDPGWDITANVATELHNSVPALLLSTIDVANKRISGSFTIPDDAGDDDMIGLVFGYQGNHKFYVFDWMNDPAVYPECGKSRIGMHLRVVNGGPASALTCADLWGEEGTNNTQILPVTNEVPDGKLSMLWEAGVVYDFELEFKPGSFKIRILQDDNLIAAISSQDATFSSGKFAFYAYSQPNAQFRLCSVSTLD